MGEAKTDYDPNNYNRESLANIMQFITSDLMIRDDIEGAEAFAGFQPQIVKIRKRIEGAYRMPSNKVCTLANIAEGVLLWLRDGATVKQVLKAPLKALLIRGKKVQKTPPQPLPTSGEGQ